MDTNCVIAALVDALNGSTRPPALAPLARIKYLREIDPIFKADGTMIFLLAKWGWEYKHRGPRPKIPPPVDTAAIQAVLSAALPDGYTITNIHDDGKKIFVSIGGKSL